MRTVILYIGGTKVDLSGQDLILMNWTQNDLTDPTIVKNSYSQTIELEGTPANNMIFGGMIRLDRKTSNTSLYTGASFDPMRRTPFSLYDDRDAILASGYVKLNSVNRKGGHYTYSITLYGGLGGFFYSLSYNEDGSKKTLADLDFGLGQSGFSLVSRLTSADILDAWDVMGGASPASKRCKFWDIINFAPCYNGLPADFDSNKAIVVDNYENIPFRRFQDGILYGTRNNANANLLTFTNKHTEWEIGDLRCYLQRPVVSMRAIIAACCNPANNGGHTVTLNGDVFHTDRRNRIYWDSWVTLPQIPGDKRYSADALVSLLEGTISPADYLLSFAKMCGLYFVYDNADGDVAVMDRNAFYGSMELLDITDRIDLSSGFDVQPVASVAKYYQLGGESLGEFAANYKVQYGRDYGIQRINTGYDFDANDKVLTDGISFASAPDVMEFSRLFGPNQFTRDAQGGYEEYFILPKYETVKLKLWGTKEGDTEESSIDVEVQPPLWGAQVWDNPSFPMGDFMPKVQLHDAEGKAIDGANVLLMFNMMRDVPRLGSAGGPPSSTRFFVSDDPEDLDLLNDGVSCWNLAGNRQMLRMMPSFRRFYIDTDGETVLQSLEWGVPLAVGDPSIDTVGVECVYRYGWQSYLADLLSQDTMVMKCKVNLSGLEVGQQLLRRFFWYGGSVWVLNGISNHSLTTDDLTECEFIRVQDMENYTNGQDW